MLNNFTPLKRFVKLLAFEKKNITLIFYYAIFSGIVSLSLPLGIQSIVSLIQVGQISTSWIILVILVTLGVVFSGILQLMQLRIIETIQQRIFVKSSFELSYRFPKIKFATIRNFYLPELANRFFDTLTIQKGLSKILIDIPTALLQIIFALILLSFYHPFFIIFGILLLVLLYSVFKFTMDKGIETSLKKSKHKYRVAHWLQEIARSVISFKSSGKTQFALSKNDSLVSDYLNARESHFKVLVSQYIQMMSFKTIVTSGLLIIGGVLVLKNEMSIGQFIAAEIVILLIITSVEKLIIGLDSFYDVLTSLEKLGQLLDKPLENQTGETPDMSKHLTIELEDLSYSVEEKTVPLLKNISLKISSGEHVHITGNNGSGKSSLIKVIAGIYEPTQGNIYLNNLNFSSLNINELRSEIGLILSEETPFEGTIKENITLENPNITDSKLFDIIEHIGLTSFIKEQKLGLQTVLYPEGKYIPSSVSKKILLARALAKQPKVLIMEDIMEHYSQEEAKQLSSYITKTNSNMIVVYIDRILHWESFTTQTIILENGKIKSIKS